MDTANLANDHDDFNNNDIDHNFKYNFDIKHLYFKHFFDDVDVHFKYDFNFDFEYNFDFDNNVNHDDDIASNHDDNIASNHDDNIACELLDASKN